MLQRCPGLTISEAQQPNQFTTIFRPGDKMEFEPLQIRFLVDEDMENYNEIKNWLYGLVRPNQYSQYVENNDETVYSDGSLIIESSNRNANIMYRFENMMPTQLTPLEFDVQNTQIQYLEATATFRYTTYSVDT